MICAAFEHCALISKDCVLPGCPRVPSLWRSSPRTLQESKVRVFSVLSSRLYSDPIALLTPCWPIIFANCLPKVFYLDRPFHHFETSILQSCTQEVREGQYGFVALSQQGRAQQVAQEQGQGQHHHERSEHLWFRAVTMNRLNILDSVTNTIYHNPYKTCWQQTY